ncbi:MAG: branched-chain amino acid ABC transporter permease [Alphaproteobacteria bacterium]|nr:branched-chain amino acid ABC transporter permease [Alphaproteobacteria bacterium]
MVQTFNGLQLGVMLFLMAAGLTLVLGIMDFVNLAHGSLLMVGAYVASTITGWTGSFLLGLAAALPAAFLAGVLLEVAVLRHFYDRGHLEQVLATFGLILFFNEAVRLIWGPAALFFDPPSALRGQVEILPGAPYPAFRLAIIVVGLAVALALYLVIARTRVGMRIRAGASNRDIAQALGLDIGRLFAVVFGAGAALAGLAGVILGPITNVEPGMGDPVLILAFVVIIIGGIGSVRGAFAAALLVGLVDTLGRAFLPILLRLVLNPSNADAAGPALASMLIYLLMAAILFFRPHGLFPARTG